MTMNRFLKVLRKYSVGIFVVFFSIGGSIFLSIVLNHEVVKVVFKVLFGIAGALLILGLIIAFVYSEEIEE